MVHAVWYVLCCWRDTGVGSSYARLPFGRRGLPRACVVTVDAVLWLLLSILSGCSLMLFVVLRFGLLGTVCCSVSAAPGA